MGLTGGRQIVRELWEAGARYGRPPEPTPEVDPWEDDDPYGPPRELAVTFNGFPALTVRLYLDGADTVTVEDSVDLDVPRKDTVAVVEALISGRARMRRLPAHPLTRLLGVLLRVPYMAELVVHLPDVGRTYTAQARGSYFDGSWISRMTWEPGSESSRWIP